MSLDLKKSRFLIEFALFCIKKQFKFDQLLKNIDNSIDNIKIINVVYLLDTNCVNNFF